MLNRREFLSLLGATAVSMSLPGCAASPHLSTRNFPEFGTAERPYLGLATSLRDEFDYDTNVEGTVPSSLRGSFYRNGPGLFDRGGLRKRSLLDGDGMIQLFLFHDRGVKYRNRFVRTKKYVDESAAARYIYPSWSTQAPGGLVGNFWAAGRVLCQAGITVYLRNGKLYAFDESNLPYELNPENLETIQQSSLGLPGGFSIYSAHSKIDYKTGEWIMFGVQYGAKPRIHLTVFTKNGSLKSHHNVKMPRYVYIHDWFVTEGHFIFALHPAEIRYWPFLLGLRSMQDSLRWRPEIGNHILVVQRDGSKKPLHLDTEACYMWHSINAFEENGSIVADFIGYKNPDHFIGDDPAITASMLGRDGTHSYPGEIRRYVLQLGTRMIKQERLYTGSCEWPRINEMHLCHKYRFSYMAKCREREFFWSIIIRFDMHTGKTASYDFGPGVYCSEPVFVPLPNFSYNSQADNEPGYLLTEVYDSKIRKNFLAVLAADGVGNGPIARIHLNHHAPFSFHGFWAQRQ